MILEFGNVIWDNVWDNLSHTLVCSELTVPDETMQQYCSGLDNKWLANNHRIETKKRSFDRIAGFNQARVKFEQSKLAKIDDQSECGSILDDFWLFFFTFLHNLFSDLTDFLL